MTPEIRLQLANDRIADLHRERTANRLLATTRRQAPRQPRLPLFTSLRRVVGAFAA